MGPAPDSVSAGLALEEEWAGLSARPQREPELVEGKVFGNFLLRVVVHAAMSEIATATPGEEPAVLHTNTNGIANRIVRRWRPSPLRVQPRGPEVTDRWRRSLWWH